MRQALQIAYLPRARFQSVDRRVARRAVTPLPLIVLAAGGLAIFGPTLSAGKTASSLLNVGLVLLSMLLAAIWWVPWTAIIGAGGGALATLWLVSLTSYAGPLGENMGSIATRLASLFLTTFLLLAAGGNALRILAWNGKRKGAPQWLWYWAGLGSAILLIEKLVVERANQDRREWLGHTVRIVEPAPLYQYFLWDLYYELAWLLLLVAAAAIYRLFARHWFPNRSPEAFRAAALLFLIGPIWWDLEVAGFSVPAWPLGLAAIGLLVRLYTRRMRPVLTTVADQPLDPEALKVKAESKDAHQLVPGLGARALHLLLALGPGGDPRGNLIAAVRGVVLPGLLAGAVLVLIRLMTAPLVTINQQVSVLLDLVGMAGWEFAKWLLAAAAIGLAWQHLPGRRGIVKMLPVLLTYAAAPVTVVTIELALGLGVDWRATADLLLFAAVMLILGLRMDLAVLAEIKLEPVGSRLRTKLQKYGIDSIAAAMTVLVTPALAILAVWSATQGGDVSFPSVDTGHLQRR
ncbi:DUF6185 family protein [Amycolatopsis sp. CB00013]|uniref:DUF6185 family protein n=1 Tax=Amycolatopsis sp. CB00013 TaxID=1703945 RepID=UPI000938DE1D|nr:DUF6185 family protein [Amycolatopsis sp. CB00013]OKJ95658.1 hypothetical protein AMK34_21885 [Amycolatopsis sp. CB00013]